MHSRTAIIVCSCISLGVILWTLQGVPSVWPLLSDPAVRTAAPEAMAQLRAQGLWLVDTELVAIERKTNEICFEWEHIYHGRNKESASKRLTTCVPHSS